VGNLNIHDSKQEIYPYIIDCICLNFSEKEALSYLHDKGFKICPPTYYRLKNEVKENTFQIKPNCVQGISNAAYGTN
jgi:hypothetical protein